MERSYIPPEEQILDLAGVGIGPFNMSVAALLEPHSSELSSLFFDRQAEFSWHPGLLLPEGSVQVSFMKDPVTLADPTSRYSFLSYMHEKRRLYRFIIAGFPKIKRMEFNQYFRWVCDSLPNVRFGHPVEGVDLAGDRLVLDLGTRRVSARNVVLGTGLAPKIPECARPHVGDTVFHSGQYLHKKLAPGGKRVVVVGGGQSGAELVNHLLTSEPELPGHLTWLARRGNFLPLDDTPFVEEFFTPSYSEYFFRLPAAKREELIKEQRFASDGVNAELLAAIYRRLYELEFLESPGRMFSLRIATELRQMRPAAGGGWELVVHDRVHGETHAIEADIVVLATGFGFQLPACLEPLEDRLALDDEGRYHMREDYSIVWDGPPELKIFAQNAARHCRGVPDPNLSLMAWRSATIINSLAGRTVFDVSEASSAFDWARPGTYSDGYGER